MTPKKWLIVGCLVLSSGFVQAATLEEQAQLWAARIHSELIFMYFDQGEFKEALPWAEKVLKIRTEILGEKHVDTFDSLNTLALTYQKLGRNKEALSLAQKSFSIFQEVEADLGYNKVLNLVISSGIYLGLGQLDEALELAEKSYSLTADDEEPLFPLVCMMNLAVVHVQLGHFNEALTLLNNSVSLINTLSDDQLATIPNSLDILRNSIFLKPLLDFLGTQSSDDYNKVLKYKLIAQLLNNLAMTYYLLGQLDQALPLIEKAYHYRLEALGEKHPETLESMNNLAVIYKDLGRLADALSLLEKGYRLAKKGLGDKHLYTIIGLNQLAYLYQELGRLDEALPLFEKSHQMAKTVLGEKHFQTLHILNNLGVIHRKLGHHDKALSLVEKAYRLAMDAVGDKHPITIANVNNLAEIHLALNHSDNALSLFEQGYQLAEQVFGEKQPKTITSLNNLGGMYQSLGRLNDALPLFEKSYRLGREVLGDNNRLTLTALSNLAALYVEKGQTQKGYIQKGIEHFEQLVAGIESLRRSDLSTENRQALFQQLVINYVALSYLYINQSRPVDAFRLAEMSKARTLLESITAQLAAQQSGLSADEQQQLQDYEARLAFLNNRIAKAWENNRLEAKLVLESNKNQWGSQFNQFHQQLIAKYPKYAQLSDVEIVGAKDGAKYLPTDAVLISYLVVHGNQVLAFTLQSDGTLTAHDLGKIPNLEENVKDYRYRLSLTRGLVLSGKPKKDIDTLSRELGQQLLEPIKHLINGKSRWIISPSGLLALIPFETLRVDGEEQPVIVEHQVSYVQSLSVLKLLQERDKEYKTIQNRGTLLAMGAPLYQQQSAYRSSLPTEDMPAAVETVNPSTVDFNIARNLVMRGGDYGRAFRQIGQMRWLNLPGTLTEISELEALFKETAPAIYIKDQATEAQLQRLNQQHELANYRYLVFAAHGYLSTEVPALSSIVLGQVNNPPGIDGYVSASEWPSYDLKSDLTVLSACQTGRGEVVGGEGVMGLPYAFYVAGNKNTLLTLWEISDEVSAEFVTSFFKKLKDGIAQVDALTATKREFLNKGGRYSDPAYWAAFLLYGI